VRGNIEEKRLPLAPYPQRVGKYVAIFVPLGFLFAAGLPGDFLWAGLTGSWGFGFTTSLVAAMFGLSFVVLAGYVGQISLVQISLAGTAAFITARFVANEGPSDANPFAVGGPHWPWPVASVIGVIVAIIVGLIVAIPALRIRGGALHGPNVTWSTYLLVGGDGRQNYTNNGVTASVCSTNGNLHMDAASGYQMYLNYYDGDQINFGNGANGNIGSITSAGNLSVSGNVTANSDRKLKTNIKTIQNALDMVSRMRGVYFDWIKNGNQSIGLIAQEVQEVIPELVLENVIKNPPSFPGEETPEDRILSVDYGKIVSVLIEAIKEQQIQIEEQNKRIAFLEAK
jgi:hypothetical protein